VVQLRFTTGWRSNNVGGRFRPLFLMLVLVLQRLEGLSDCEAFDRFTFGTR